MAPSPEFMSRVAAARFAVLRFARQLTKDIDQAEDLAQDVLLRAIQKHHLYQETGRLDSWLLHMTYTMFVNSYRKRRRDLLVAAAQLFNGGECLVHCAVAPAQEVVETVEAVKRGLAELEPPQSEIVFAIAWDGITYSDAAERFGVPVGTIRSRVSRARASLRRSIEGDAAPVRRRRRRRSKLTSSAVAA